MEYRFANSKLECLYLNGTGAKRYPPGVVDAFIKRVRSIEAAKDEQDLRAFKSYHFEKLRSSTNLYSMRLNKAWRLILRFEKDKHGKIVVLININRHYGG